MGISPVPLGLYGDETITACAWIFGITGLGFVVRSLTFGRPVIDLRAIAIRNFSLCWWVSFVTGIGIFTDRLSDAAVSASCAVCRAR